MKLHDFLPWWFWLVGGLGLVGAAAALVAGLMLVPSIAMPLIARIGERAARLIFAVISTPLGAALVAGTIAWSVSAIHSAHIAADAATAKIEQLRHAAELAAQERDADIEFEIERTYAPVIATLNEREAQLQQEAQAYERQIIALAADARCQLGPDALKLRNRPQVRGAGSAPAGQPRRAAKMSRASPAAKAAAGQAN